MTTIANDSRQGAVPLIGRILLAIIFILSGLSKLANPAGTQGYIASAGLPLPLLGYIVALVVEIGGGLMLLVGYRTRFAAIALAIFTVAAAVFFHHAFGDQNQFIHFMKNLAIAGGLLQVVAFGSGTFSLDNRRAAVAQRKLA
jgi:putative oxidoreductase